MRPSLAGGESNLEYAGLFGFGEAALLEKKKKKATAKLCHSREVTNQRAASLDTIITLPVTDAPLTFYPPIVLSTFMNNSSA